MNNNPIVSVFIVAYNSSEYILEALESVKAQTYDNIELVISDDKSTDCTVQIAKEWVDKNRDRFVNVTIVESIVNSGPTGNYNRAVAACHGEWLKMLDGDDKMLPRCIEDNLKFVQDNPDALIIVSNSIVFFDNGRKDKIQNPGKLNPEFFKQNSSEQFESLVRSDVLLNPNSTFISSKVYKIVKYDERIRFMEDRPFYWNCTKNGFKIHHFDKETVMYRKYDGALTGLSKSKLLSLYYQDALATFYYLIRKTELEKRNLNTCLYEKQILWYLFAKHVLKNKSNIITRFIKRVIEHVYIK